MPPSPPFRCALALSCALATGASAENFEDCLGRLQEQARNEGVADWIVDDLMPSLEEQRRVIELDRQQPEFVRTFAQYMNARVTEKRVSRGRELYARHADLLQSLQDRYGVPGRYLLAFWGLETNFGSYLGSTPTLDSLATLACDQRRSQFFTDELITALKLVERDQLEPDNLKGSWAGAMGHTQFMPSTYARYAVDGDGDGRIDLWGSPADALASGANFLQQLGWREGLRWGREVKLPNGFDYQLAGLSNARALSAWADLGIRRADGAPLPAVAIEAAVLVPAGAEGPAFLVYENFRIIMGWNRSEFYALSVGHLADRIAGGGKLWQPAPEQRALTVEEVRSLQRRLGALGYELGAVDGILGPGTRKAITEFQRDNELVADGYPGKATLRKLAQ